VSHDWEACWFREAPIARVRCRCCGLVLTAEEWAGQEPFGSNTGSVEQLYRLCEGRESNPYTLSGTRT
jgi:hypothetical protein